MTQHLDDITSAIAGLTISGVTILDVDEIRDSITLRAGETILMPEPLDFISNMSLTRETLGDASTRYMDLEYDLTYTYFYAPLASTRGLRDIYSGMGAKFQAIIHGITNHDFHSIGAWKCEPQNILAYGKVADPLENEFYGFRFSVHCMEIMKD